MDVADGVLQISPGSLSQHLPLLFTRLESSPARVKNRRRSERHLAVDCKPTSILGSEEEFQVFVKLMMQHLYILTPSEAFDVVFSNVISHMIIPFKPIAVSSYFSYLCIA